MTMHLLIIFVLIFEARETFNLAVLEILLSFTCLLIPEVKSEPVSVTGYSITEEKKKMKEGIKKKGRKGGRERERNHSID